MDDWLWFLGIYIAEGCVNRADLKKHHYVIDIAAVKPAKRIIIEKRLRKLPWNIYSLEDRFRINNRALCKYLEPLGRAKNKRVPDFIKHLPPHRIKRFLEGYGIGDGHTSQPRIMFSKYQQKSQTTYYTSSKRLADDLQELLLKIGKVGNIRHAFSEKIFSQESFD